MFGDYIFEIPVYRITLDKHNEEFGNRKKKLMSEMASTEEEAPECYKNFSDYIDSKQILWKYNEIIYWICLYTEGNQFITAGYNVTNKRLNRAVTKKKFKFNGTEFKIDIQEESSEQIYEIIIYEFDKLKRNKYFKNKYIDLAPFKNIGKYVDWRKLLIENNKF